MHFTKCMKLSGRPGDGNQTLGFNAISVEFYIISLPDLI